MPRRAGDVRTWRRPSPYGSSTSTTASSCRPGPNRQVAQHGIVAGLESQWPQLLGLNEIVAKDGGQTLAECAGHPLLVIGEYGEGRAAAFASDIAPHWAPPGFTQWSGYGTLFDRLVRWVAGEDLG